MIAPQIPQKIAQIKDFVDRHPGCTTYEIIRAFDISYRQMIYYSAYTGIIRAEKDVRQKRGNIYFPISRDQVYASCISEKEKVPE